MSVIKKKMRKKQQLLHRTDELAEEIEVLRKEIEDLIELRYGDDV